MKRILFLAVFLASALVAMAQDSPVSVSLEAEAGAVKVLHHTYQVGADSYNFDFVANGGQEILFPFQRFTATAKIADRHQVKFLYQPLTVATEITARDSFTIDTVTFLAEERREPVCGSRDPAPQRIYQIHVCRWYQARRVAEPWHRSCGGFGRKAALRQRLLRGLRGDRAVCFQRFHQRRRLRVRGVHPRRFAPCRCSAGRTGRGFPQCALPGRLRPRHITVRHNLLDKVRGTVHGQLPGNVDGDAGSNPGTVTRTEQPGTTISQGCSRFQSTA